MPTTRKRYTVSLPDDLHRIILNDCSTFETRSEGKVGARILSVLLEHYQMRINQPMIFGRSQPIVAESRRARPLVFRGSSRPVELPASGRREALGQK